MKILNLWVFVLVFISSNSFAIDCKIDPSFLKTAKATGGGVFCPQKVPSALGPLTLFYELVDHNIDYYAFWKILTRHSLDRHTYSSHRLPKDHFILELSNFPIDEFKISAIYTENSSGERSKAAKFLRETKQDPRNINGKLSNFSTFEYELKPKFDEYQLVLEGTTQNGTPFIQYSNDVLKSSGKTDKALGVETWAKIFKLMGKELTESAKNKLLKQAFEE